MLIGASFSSFFSSNIFTCSNFGLFDSNKLILFSVLLWRPSILKTTPLPDSFSLDSPSALNSNFFKDTLSDNLFVKKVCLLLFMGFSLKGIFFLDDGLLGSKETLDYGKKRLAIYLENKNNFSKESVEFLCHSNRFYQNVRFCKNVLFFISETDRWSFN